MEGADSSSLLADLLCTEPIVFFVSLWAGFSWGSLYLLVEAVPLIFGNVYGFNAGQVGLVFYSVVCVPRPALPFRPPAGY